MRIISVGEEIQNKNVNNIKYRSTTSFLDAELLIWNPSKVFEEYNAKYPEYKGCRNINDDDSSIIFEDIKRRRNEISDLLKLGRTIVLLLPPPTKCYYWTGEYQYSGTGKNRAKTRIVDDIYLSSIIPINDFDTVVANGNSIEFKGEEPYKSYWEKMKQFHYYSAYLSSDIGKPILFITGTNKVVASIIKQDNGIIILLPYIIQLSTFKSKKEQEKFSDLFIEAIVTLVTELKKSSGDYVLPEWANKYYLPNEIDERKELSKKEENLLKLLNDISKNKEKIAIIEKYKLLFSGSGHTLENQVAEVLEEMGFSIIDKPEGRDDLIIKYDDKIAVVEIKGVNKSAAEKHAAQLEKWVSEHYSSYEIKCKGILIVNAFCNTPLELRTDDPFPSQMLVYSEHREHCLITTTQLLGLYLKVKLSPDEKEICVNELFNTIGVYQKFKDYTNFIEIDKLESNNLNKTDGLIKLVD